jgi:hypothetical protein
LNDAISSECKCADPPVTDLFNPLVGTPPAFQNNQDEMVHIQLVIDTAHAVDLKAKEKYEPMLDREGDAGVSRLDLSVETRPNDSRLGTSGEYKQKLGNQLQYHRAALMRGSYPCSHPSVACLSINFSLS